MFNSVTKYLSEVMDIILDVEMIKDFKENFKIENLLIIVSTIVVVIIYAYFFD